MVLEKGVSKTEGDPPPFQGPGGAELKAGDEVSITGTLYTARDAAHKRLVELLDKGEKLPIEQLLEAAVGYMALVV